MYRLNTKIRLTMLCLSGFKLYSRWVPLTGRYICSYPANSLPELRRCQLHNC